MSSKTRVGLALLASALFLGVLGDELLRVTPLGLNAFLWIAALCAVVVVLAERMGSGLSEARLWMIPTLLLFSGLLVWRDSAWLVALDLFAIVVALSLGALRTRGRSDKPA